MRASVLIVLLFFSSFSISAAEKKYAISNLSKELIKNADVVIRENHKKFEVKSKSEAIERIKTAITVLTESGDSKAIFVKFYSKLLKIYNIKINIYDANGNLIKKVKDSEIFDVSAISGFSLYEDNRLKYFKPTVRNYPYTIEYEFEYRYNGLFFTSAWYPFFAYNMAVENSSFTLVVPPQMEYRFKEMNLTDSVNVFQDKKNKIYRWTVSDLEAISWQPYSPNPYEFMPIVHVAPVEFKLKGYSGDLSSWKSFGEWISKLNEGLDELPDETIDKVRQMVSYEDKYVDKVKILYEYMQSKTRYVSIQIGIGGFQPFAASVVDKVGYGDCKALSNYMRALLKVVGIKSHYTLVKAGNDHYLHSDFPSSQFNHAILCVPTENDTIWLECTSQTIPFGYLGDFTDDRDVLLITDEGGKLAHTKNYKQEVNKQERRAIVNLSEDGHAMAKVVTKYSGLQYYNDEIRPLLEISKEDQRKKLNETISLSNFKINSFDLNKNKKLIPDAVLKLNLDVKKYASLTGRRLFLPLNSLNVRKYNTKIREERNVDFDYRGCYYDADTITYTLPDNFKVEYLPKDIEYKSEIGEYKTEVQLEDNKLTYIRIQKMQKGRFPAERYTEFVDFFKKINKADNAKAVLVKKEI